jgi:hypothetical protein
MANHLLLRSCYTIHHCEYSTIFSHNSKAPRFSIFLGSIAYIGAFCTPFIYNKILDSVKFKRIVPTRIRESNIEAKEIIQIDATIITGFLIFLTLVTSLSSTESQTISTIVKDIAKKDNIPIQKSSDSESDSSLGAHLAEFGHTTRPALLSNITGTIIIIFAFSAISASIFRSSEIGRRLMVAGFIYIFFAIIPLTYF